MTSFNSTNRFGDDIREPVKPSSCAKHQAAQKVLAALETEDQKKQDVLKTLLASLTPKA